MALGCVSKLGATLATAFVGLFIQRRRRRRAEAVRFNFGEASSRGGLAHGALRPGSEATRSRAPGAVGDAEVREWVEFVRARGVRRVLSLLGDDEIAWHGGDLDAAMRRDFSRYDRTSVFAPGARDVALAAFDAAREAGEPIVMHCSGGRARGGSRFRSGSCITTDWTPGDAVAEVVAVAGAQGTERKPSVEKLKLLLAEAPAPAKEEVRRVRARARARIAAPPRVVFMGCR